VPVTGAHPRVGLRPPAQSRQHWNGLNIEENVMPKLKTKRGAAKRFRAKGNGGFKSGHAHKRHILTKKSPKRKRQLGRPMQVHESDVDSLRQQLPYA
jgi:large subunit ribosomal protein L35